MSLNHLKAHMKAFLVGMALYWLYIQAKRRCCRKASPYLIKSETKVPTVLGNSNIGLESIPTLVQEMRESFDSGVSRPLETRIAQLKALKALFVENEAALVAALQKDLGRPKFECLYYDLFVPLTEIDHMIKNLPSYIRPQKRPFNLITFPSTNLIIQEPKGVVLIIGTWNYPFMLSCVPLLGAIAAGNCVILKPCNVSSHCAKLLAELIPKYMNPRIVSCVGTAMEGDRTTTAALLKHKFDHIFFTGSPDVGRVIMEGAAKFLTPVTLELGGKNPVFVDKTADLELASKRVVWGRMMNAGQQCISPDYVLVEKDVVEDFAVRCGEWARKLYGEGDAPKTNGDFGKIVGDKQTQRLIQVLSNHNGKVIYGGGYDEKQRYIQPTIIRCDLKSPAMKDETFGPILLVVSVDSMEEAIEYVNSRPKPLSLYIFSRCKKTQDKIVYNTSSGGVTINGTLFHCGHPDLPFGGIGDSGIGAYHGEETFKTFSHPKPVLKKSMWPDGGLLSDPFFLYPPWTPLKEKIVRFLVKFM